MLQAARDLGLAPEPSPARRVAGPGGKGTTQTAGTEEAQLPGQDAKQEVAVNLRPRSAERLQFHRARPGAEDGTNHVKEIRKPGLELLRPGLLSRSAAVIELL